MRTFPAASTSCHVVCKGMGRPPERRIPPGKKGMAKAAVIGSARKRTPKFPAPTLEVRMSEKPDWTGRSTLRYEESGAVSRESLIRMASVDGDLTQAYGVFACPLE